MLNSPYRCHWGRETGHQQSDQRDTSGNHKSLCTYCTSRTALSSCALALRAHGPCLFHAHQSINPCWAWAAASCEKEWSVEHITPRDERRQTSATKRCPPQADPAAEGGAARCGDLVVVDRAALPALPAETAGSTCSYGDGSGPPWRQRQ